MGTALFCVGKDGTLTSDNGQHFWSNWRTGIPESQGDGLATNLAPCHLPYWFKNAPVLWAESVPGRSDHFCITLDKFLGCWSPNNLRKTGSWGGGEEYRIWLSSPEANQQRAQGILVTLGLQKVVCQGDLPCLGDRVWGNVSITMGSGVTQTRILYKEVKWSFPSLDDLIRADH